MDDIGLLDYEWEYIINGLVRIYILPEIARQNITATGRLVESLKARQNKLVGVDYVEYSDRGRGPGGMPPVNKLIEWVEVKLGLTGKEAISTAWAIATKIKEEGSLQHREGGYSQFLYVLNTPRVREYIQNEAGKILVRKVRVNINNFIKTRV